MLAVIPQRVFRSSVLVLAAVSFLTMATAASSAQTAVPPAAGDGLTTATAYQIAELGNLVWMGDTVTSSSGKYYTLTGDIDASDTANWNDTGTTTDTLEGFKPIGYYGFYGWGNEVSFRGVLDGAGYTVTGLTIDRATTQAAVGLFASIGADARISNLKLEGGAIRGRCIGGALAGHSAGKLANCRANCPVSCLNNVGGLVCYCSTGTVTNCQAEGAVTTVYGGAGGLVGWADYNVVISGCSASGAARGGGDLGGLVGSSTGAWITRCHASGQVTSVPFDDDYPLENTGGLVGWNTGSITDCYANGPVSGGRFVGGLVGQSISIVSAPKPASDRVANPPIGRRFTWTGTYQYASIANCYATGLVAGQTNVGGLVGYSTSGTTTSSYWDTESTNQTASRGGTGKTTAQMKQQATYLPAGPGAGQWDFAATWGIQGGYPYLRQFPVHTLTYTAGANGSVDGAASETQTVNDGGRSAPVFATATAGYHFSHWSDGAKDNPRIDANVVADGSVTALFSDQCTLTYLAGPNGTIAGATSQTLTQGDNGTQVTAIGAADYHFLRWSDGVMTAARIDLAVANDITVTAFFVPDWCTLIYTASSGGSLDGATSQTVAYAQSGTAVLAVPDPGWCFRRWSDGSTANPRTDTNVTANLSVTAQFQPVVQIHTLAELQAVATRDLTTNYVLMNDIDASVTATWNDAGTTTDTLEGFRPIGVYSRPDTTSFRGIFEGNGHKIVGLTVNRAATYEVGLFGIIGTGGIVRNLHLEGGTISGAYYIGGLAGYNIGGTLTSCTATLTVTGGQYIGGLAGANGTSGTITNCSAGGATMGTFSVGGLVGGNFSVTGITNCYATGVVTVPSSLSYAAILVGGLVGYNSGGTIADCYATGAVSSPAVGLIEAGGLVGETNGGSTITNSYAIGTVTGNNTSAEMGGLVGSNSDSTITNCYATGAVTGSSSPTVGGLVGTNYVGTITSCYWDTQTTGQATSDGGTSATTAQMMQQGTYLPAGSLPGQWDFASVWGINGAYPYLRSLPTYTLTYTAGPNGSIDGATSRSQTVNQGVDGGAVAAVPAALHHFVRWSDASTANPRTDTNVVANIDVTATFASGPNTLTYTAGPGGSITGATSQTVTTGADGTQVTAVPAPHYHFVRWSDSVMTAARTDLNVTSNISVLALFTIDLYHLAYAAGPGGSVTGATSQTLNYGGNGTQVTAVPITGYHFVRWSDGVLTVARRDMGVTADIAVTASFAINLYSLTYAAGPGGSLDGVTSQTVAHGQSGTAVLAVADVGGSFTNWSDGSTANPRTDANVMANLDVTARFRIVYEVRTLAELQAVATGDLNGRYMLMNDVDASDTANWNDSGTDTGTLEGFHPIGTYAAPFRGVFEGNGYRIVGLKINRFGEDYVGLFGYIARGAGIADLGLEGGVVSGQSNTGGLVGYSDSGTVTNCYTTGSVRGRAKSGWWMFVFFPGSPCSVGGLVGCNSGGAIVECHAASQVLGSAVPPFLAFSTHMTGAGDGYSCYVGGLVGSNAAGAVTHSSATGSVSGYAAAGFYYDNGYGFGNPAPGSAYVGGLIGSNTGGSVAACFADGAATGVTAAYTQALAGGVAGKNAASGRIVDCYARGEATIGGSPTASDHTGGLVADNAGSGVVARCYATGMVSGGSTGGLAASSSTSATITACYWDAQTTSQTTSAGGTSKTTAEMKQQATFVGWDFQTVWSIAEDLNWGYPYLRGIGPLTNLPNKPAVPSPANGATDRPLDTTLGWQNGGGAASYDVYFGTANPPVTRVATSQTETSYAPPSSLAYGTTYFWRIDAKNPAGTTPGDVWRFTTVPAPKVPGHFLSRRVKSSHSEKWDGKGARIVAKDAYSFSAKMQLPVDSLASISNATTLTLVLGDAVTSGAACEVFERPLSAATKSTLAGHPTAKKPKDPTRGGSVTFVELQPNSKKKARVVTIKWTKTGVLTATVVGAPAPANWDPANPAEHRKVENIADLCDGAEWPEGLATGVAVPTLVDLSGVFIGADTVACGGKKSVKPSDGGDLVGWSVSGK